MDYKAIEQIIKTAGESGLTFLEIETEGIRITMKKGNTSEEPKVKAEECVSSETQSSDVEVLSEEVEKKEDKNLQDENIVSVVSPIVGTFYASSAPDAESFVSVGSKVKKGDTLCVIEAMKLMNEIEAEVDGEIVEVLVDDEQMVEYGQELFKIALN